MHLTLRVQEIHDLWKSVAPEMWENKPKIWFALHDVNPPKNGAEYGGDIVAKHFAVKETPDIRLFVDTIWHTEYKGRIEAEYLKQWIKKRCNLPSKQITEAQQWKREEENQIAKVVYIGPLDW